MAGVNGIFVLLMSSAWINASLGLQETNPTSNNTVTGCSDAEVYLKHDWNTFISCCKVLYPNQTCHVACPCRNGASCNPINRSCICKPGWVGSNCQTSCREKNNSTYGPSCKRGCRCGLDAACEPITGVCECINPDNCTARCPINRYGPKCRQKCRCKTGGCDHITGVCTVADTSQRSCGCLNRGTCRLHGKPCRCPAAWTGQLCDEPCPPGYYGDDCSIQCECGENATCSRSTGLCGCATEDRYSCLGRCPQGLFGPRCSNQCSCPVGLVCNHWTGDCECAAGDCQDLLLGNTTDVSTATVTIPRTTQLEPLKTITITAGTTFPRPPSPTPPSSGTLLHHTIQKTTVNIPTTARSMTRAAAKKHSVKPAPASGTDAATDGSPLRSDDEAVAGGNEFYPTAPFWGVVGAIAALLLVVVVLLLLILRRQVSSPRSALTRQPKIYRQDNVYETVDELSKGAPTEQEVTKTPPALPDMFQRGGSIRSSVHNYHRRPLSVHSPLPAMDAPLPASVAAMVCNYGSAPPLPGGTSRRSLMAEWRPNGKQESAAEKAKSRPHSNVVDEPQTVDRSGKSLSCIYHGGVTIEDDYADPFDSIAPTGNTGNRPPGYLPMILGKDDRRSQSPVQQNRPVSPAGLQRCSSPMTVQRSDSPMTVQRCESPMSVQRERCESPMSVQRCESPMSVQRSSSLMNIPRTGSPLTVNHSEPNLNLYQTDSNMNIPSRNSPVALRKEANGSSSTSLQRQSATPNIDPFYFTLEQQVNLDSPKIPDDDYDELEPQSLINSPAGGLPINNRSTSRTSSERSRVSSQASSRGSLSAASPTLASPFGSSPRDAEMFAVLDRRPETTRPDLAQRPLSSNAYEPCGPPTKSVSPPDDGVYSRLSRAPSQKIELPKCPRGVADLDTNPYGRLQRSYSAKNFTRNPDTYDGPYGKLPQRSRSAMVKSQQVSGSTAECVASEWVPAEPHPRLPPRGTKPPNVTEPRKKFRWSLKGKLSKKSSPEEVDYDCPTSTATLPYPGDCKGL